MKKIIIIGVAIAALLAGLIGGVVYFYRHSVSAGPTTTAPTQTTAGPDLTTTAPPETTVAPVDIHLESPLVSISLPVIRETDTADDAREIFRRTFQDVVLSATDPDVAKTVTLDILRRMDGNSALLSSIQSGAYTAYTGQESWMPYFYKLLYSPQRIDAAVLSLFGQENTYNGAQSSHTGVAVNYNLLTGTVLKLSDVLTEQSSTYDALLSALLAALEEHKTDNMLFEYYADTVTARFQADLQSESSWFFSADGLSFFYAPYEIAPNASGIVVATVPYEALSGILLDAYFPAEQTEFPHNITGIPFAGADLSAYESFAELVTDTAAPQYILSTKGVLYDVTVEQGSWAGSSLYEREATVFRANRLSPDDALVLRAVLPEKNGTLRLSYRSGGQTYSFYLTLDTATGQIVFTPAQ